MDSSPPLARAGNPSVVSVPRLVGALWLAGLFSGAIVGVAYFSLLLFASLEAIGIPGTALLAAILLIRTEQAMVFLIEGWRPGIVPLVVSVLPATGVAFAFRGVVGWHGWLGIVVSVSVGLATQAVVLRYVAAALAKTAPEPYRGPAPGSDLAAGAPPGAPPPSEA